MSRPSVGDLLWAANALAAARVDTHAKSVCYLAHRPPANAVGMTTPASAIERRWQALIAVSRPLRATCLHRTIALGSWLESARIPFMLKIAWLDRDAHAWIEIPAADLYYGLTKERAARLGADRAFSPFGRPAVRSHSRITEAALRAFYRRRENPLPATKLLDRDYFHLLALEPGLVSHSDPKFAKLFLKNLATNQKLIAEATPAIAILRRANIAVVALKGFGLKSAYYTDGGTRSMSDVDLLVPQDKAVEALRLLSEAEWRPEARGTSLARQGDATDDVRFAHAMGLVSPTGGKLDLHWKLTSEALDPRWNREIWNHTRPDPSGDFLILDTTLQLLHACAHGYGNWSGTSAMYWAIDAAHILRDPRTPIDWDLFVASATRLKLNLVVRAALEDLRDLLGADLTAPIGALSEKTVSRFEHWEFRFKAKKASPRWQSFAWFVFSAWRNNLFAFPLVITRLPHYVSRRLGAARAWQLPYVLPLKLFKQFI